MGGHTSPFRGPERQPLQGQDNVIVAIHEEAISQIENPPSGDPIISAMWEGFLWALDKSSEFQALVGSYAAKQSVIVEPWTVGGVPISEVNGRLRTMLQYDAMRYNLRHLPTTPLGWMRQLTGLARDPDRCAAVETALDHNHTMTTSGDRLAPFEVIRQLQGGPAGFFDAASSVGIGARQTQLKDGHPFSAARLLHRDGSDDEAASDGYAQLVHGPILPGPIILSDLVPPDSRLARRLSLASLRPSEILDPAVVEQRRQLLAAKLSNVVFKRSDLLHRESMGAIREYCRHHRIRLAFVGTVLNIIGQEHVETVIDNVLWALDDHPDSEVIVADFAQVDRRKPYKLSLAPRWGRASYGYFGIRLGDRERVNSLFEFTNSRPRVGRVGDGLITVGGEVQPIRELIVAHSAGSLATHQQDVALPALHNFA